jgi:CcmD family protein
MIKRITAIITLLILGIAPISAQVDTNKVTAKTFSAEGNVINALSNDGKIYIVITVIAIIVVGLFLYLWRLDKKISKLEREIK